MVSHTTSPGSTRRECPILKAVREMHDACDNPSGFLQVDPDSRALLIGIRLHTLSLEITEEGDQFAEVFREYKRGLSSKVGAALHAYVTAVSKG